jgi:hypothetical protein
MKVLIIGFLHHKNVIGLTNILKFLKYQYIFGSISDINNFDIIYSPTEPIDSSKYPTKKFIMGPHFSVFPDENKLKIINNIHNNTIYIQPSNWATEVWVQLNIQKYLPIFTMPFPVDTNKFIPINQPKNDVFIYYKRRNPNELQFIINYLNSNNIKFHLFNYTAGYKEHDYLNILQKSKYGIIVDAHESQGFAIEEALSCNVPLIVWNTTVMSQEYGSRYNNIPCNTIPYWDSLCGEYFYEQHEFINAFELFINKLSSYNPRQYILNNLSTEICAEKWKNIIS